MLGALYDFVLSWRQTATVILLMAASVGLASRLSPTWDLRGRELFLTIALVAVTIKILVPPEMNRAVRAVTEVLLLQVRAADAFEKSTMDKFNSSDTRMTIMEGSVTKLKEEMQAEINKIKSHLRNKLPITMRMPPES
jgi:hypothetical protein